MELTELQVRVLGALAEKERTVPDTYPLTLNSLVSACNQSSNRWPIMKATAVEVQVTLDQLKAAGLVRFVHPARGERSTKYRQVLHERLGLDDAETAVLVVLLLRGPQTAGEVRGRIDRLHPVGSLDEIGALLRRLAARDEPLVRLLDRRPGERDPRWLQLLGGDHPGFADSPGAADGWGAEPAATGEVYAFPSGTRRPAEDRAEERWSSDAQSARSASRSGLAPGASPGPAAASGSVVRSHDTGGPVDDITLALGASVPEEPNPALVAAIEVLSGRVSELERQVARLYELLGEESDPDA